MWMVLEVQLGIKISFRELGINAKGEGREPKAEGYGKGNGQHGISKRAGR